MPDPTLPTPRDAGPLPVGRRRFLGYVLAGSTLVAAADLLAPPRAYADGVPTAPQVAELYDLNDAVTDACRPTANLITVEVRSDGTAHFALPRMEVGQGITTSSAMLIAEELDLPLQKVFVTLAPARPELAMNQLTGGSTTTTSTYTPIRVAAAIAKGALLDAAAIVLGDTVALLRSKDGVVHAPDGRSVTYAELAERAASTEDRRVDVELKDPREFRVIGTARNRVDALDAVTGRKQYATDLQVEGALPTMVCRAPTLNGTPRLLRNEPEILRMPGVHDVAVVDTGVAVRAETFGQCIDAIRAMDVGWDDGPVAGQSDDDIVAELRAAVPAPPALPDNPLVEVVEAEFVNYFRSNSPMDTNSAVADFRGDSLEIWAGLKTPVAAQEEIAKELGLTPDQVTVHVVQGGGSFGRRLFFDGALEAAQVSKAMGKPVKLMWHRADDARVGRTHPMAISTVRAAVGNGQVVAFQQQHTSVETDFRHGFGEIVTAEAANLPAGLSNQGYAQTIFALTQELPYDFGAVSQSIVETDTRFNTGSMRNIYSPDVRTANELVVDLLARKLDLDPVEFRLRFSRSERVSAVLERAAEAGSWGRTMPPDTAQGIAIHKEYKGASACLVEIDCRPETVNRAIHHGVGGPRVTRVTFVIDAGLVINPRGLEAQMQGGINDGIAQVLTSSLHLRDGHFLEASWDNYFYTREWNTPPDVEVIIMPSDSRQPGGAGEAGVAASMAATACAWARATGKLPAYFPVNHRDPLQFRVKPFVPPIPQSPTNGLKLTY